MLHFQPPLKRTSLADQETEVVFQAEDFRIIARKQGISFHGASEFIEDRKGLEQFAQMIAEAWKAHISLKPQLTKSLGGHT